MKNRKFALQLSLEENKDLMDEIDSLIRERARAIVREEAEDLVGGSIRDEAHRVVKTKIDGMTNYDLTDMIRSMIAREIRYNSSVFRETVEKEVVRWLNDEHNLFMSQMVKNAVDRYVSARLSGLIQPDVIKAVCDALMKKE